MHFSDTGAQETVHLCFNIKELCKPVKTEMQKFSEEKHDQKLGKVLAAVKNVTLKLYNSKYLLSLKKCFHLGHE